MFSTAISNYSTTWGNTWTLEDWNFLFFEGINHGFRSSYLSALLTKKHTKSNWHEDGTCQYNVLLKVFPVTVPSSLIITSTRRTSLLSLFHRDSEWKLYLIIDYCFKLINRMGVNFIPLSDNMAELFKYQLEHQKGSISKNNSYDSLL